MALIQNKQKESTKMQFMIPWEKKKYQYQVNSYEKENTLKEQTNFGVLHSGW